MKRLIINADDFGLTSGVNRGIVEGHRDGVITSSTLMANGRAFEDAVNAARSAPKLSVGCHIVLTDGAPVLDASETPTLLEAGTHVQFRESLRKFLVAALLGRLNENEIEAEAMAQISKLQTAGIAVSHFDTHKHTHFLPQVIRPLLRAARACGVPAVRNPFGPVRFAAIAGKPSLWKRYGQVKILGRLAGKFREATTSAGLKTPDGTLGIVGTGALDLRLFQSVIENIPEGTWEFVCHPGYNDADLRQIRTRLRESRATELATLASAAARELLASNNIQLISYKDFAEA